MNSDLLKRKVRDWASKIGKKEAVRKLVIAGLGSAVANKLANYTYESTPSHDKANILLELLKGEGVAIEDLAK